MSLNKIQELFESMIRKNEISLLADEVIPGGTLSVEEALRVYQSGYYARLTESLGENFEAVWRVLGDQEFFAACRKYIDRNPSLSFNISDFGVGFPEYLEQEYPQIFFIRDLAFFESEFKNLFHREVSLNDIGEINVENHSVLLFGNNFYCGKFFHPVYTIWKNRHDESFSLDSLDLDRIEIVFLYKARNHDIFAKTVSDREWKMFGLLKEGKTIEAAVVESGINDAQIINRFFSFLKEAEMIQGIK